MKHAINIQMSLLNESTAKLPLSQVRTSTPKWGLGEHCDWKNGGLVQRRGLAKTQLLCFQHVKRVVMCLETMHVRDNTTRQSAE